MSNVAQAFPVTTAAAEAAAPMTAQHLYMSLSQGAGDEDTRQSARASLEDYLDQARGLPDDLPADIGDMAAWITARSEAVGAEYHAYLQSRRAGAPRRYFTSKAHALYFIRAAAPTKLADGSWLFGLLARWDDPDFRPLIQTYLEELGDGVAEKNHVVLYKKLLAAHGCDQWHDLPDDHYTQGAIQLALGYDAERFLPEIIGYNLGYEQLPLHLLITAYELNELGIDPYYFTLHITVDNGGTGHAFKAVQGLEQLLPRCGDAAAFMRRVRDGYRLNELGACTTSMIAEFDLQTELVRILAAKSVVGKNMHSDYCRVGGRSINDWLAEPEQIPAMLTALESAGWIKRGEPAENSRFWKLIQSERAEMFGVFSDYEQQVLSDWIATAPAAAAANPAAAPRVLSHRAKHRALDALGLHHSPRPQGGGVRGVFRHHLQTEDSANDAGFGNALRELEQRLANLGSKQAAMTLLQSHMTPAAHHSALGLMATRMFCRLID
ncbi:iron-containing redox enzyme family protein [Duganella sp. SAP-35]|uniref:Iron-containing redox enzyme family protein n=2 Tax=Duganella aceris TaxID=2703883 RepID=A0ABX0FNQ1_9BURK|nr:iron-containing redox enzyme family protein [Duganella aceris]